MTQSKKFLRENILNESYLFHKKIDRSTAEHLECVVNNWHHEENTPDGRWPIIELFNKPKNKRILDLASGVGTFVLHGLNKGYDVSGVEPSEWKLKYIKIKIEEKNYPSWYLDRFINGVGEDLPFENNTFDFITSYQTLEHVQNVEKCLYEMLRVLKPGGQLWLQAPDYDCWYEPHYRVPFLPTMNKKIAKLYLTLIGRPCFGLSTLQWTTTKKVKSILSQSDFSETSTLDIIQDRKHREIKVFAKKHQLPHFLSKLIIQLLKCKLMFKQENHINLLITKK